MAPKRKLRASQVNRHPAAVKRQCMRTAKHDRTRDDTTGTLWKFVSANRIETLLGTAPDSCPVIKRLGLQSALQHRYTQPDWDMLKEYVLHFDVQRGRSLFRGKYLPFNAEVLRAVFQLPIGNPDLVKWRWVPRDVSKFFTRKCLKGGKFCLDWLNEDYKHWMGPLRVISEVLMGRRRPSSCTGKIIWFFKNLLEDNVDGDTTTPNDMPDWATLIREDMGPEIELVRRHLMRGKIAGAKYKSIYVGSAIMRILQYYGYDAAAATQQRGNESTETTPSQRTEGTHNRRLEMTTAENEDREFEGSTSQVGKRPRRACVEQRMSRGQIYANRDEGHECNSGDSDGWTSASSTGDEPSSEDTGYSSETQGGSSEDETENTADHDSDRAGFHAHYDTGLRSEGGLFEEDVDLQQVRKHVYEDDEELHACKEQENVLDSNNGCEGVSIAMKSVCEGEIEPRRNQGVGGMVNTINDRTTDPDGSGNDEGAEGINIHGEDAAQQRRVPPDNLAGLQGRIVELEATVLRQRRSHGFEIMERETRICILESTLKSEKERSRNAELREKEREAQRAAEERTSDGEPLTKLTSALFQDLNDLRASFVLNSEKLQERMEQVSLVGKEAEEYRRTTELILKEASQVKAETCQLIKQQEEEHQAWREKQTLEIKLCDFEARNMALQYKLESANEDLRRKGCQLAECIRTKEVDDRSKQERIDRLICNIRLNELQLSKIQSEKETERVASLTALDVANRTIDSLERQLATSIHERETQNIGFRAALAGADSIKKQNELLLATIEKHMEESRREILVNLEGPAQAAGNSGYTNRVTESTVQKEKIEEGRSTVNAEVPSKHKEIIAPCIPDSVHTNRVTEKTDEKERIEEGGSTVNAEVPSKHKEKIAPCIPDIEFQTLSPDGSEISETPFDRWWNANGGLIAPPKPTQVTDGSNLVDEARAPAGHLMCEPREHQRKGLAWMIERESDPMNNPQGGILADAMGMGKTLQTITLILSERPEGSCTLVVSPVGVMAEWAREIERRCSPLAGMSVLTYHGEKRNKPGNPNFKHYSVVLTSYGTLEREWREHQGTKDKPPRESACFTMPWFRVVLDESQYIKNHKASTSVAVCKLISSRRWCITGTPLQNTVDDIYSFFRFLQYGSYADFKVFKRLRDNCKKNYKEGMAELKRHLSYMTLRRTKGVLNLPPIENNVVRLEFADDSHYELYKEILEKSCDLWMEERKTDGVKTGQALALLMKLRQVCIHPALTIGQKPKEKGSQVGWTTKEMKEMQKILYSTNIDSKCQACQEGELIDGFYISETCKHVLCNDCSKETLEGYDSFQCPVKKCNRVGRIVSVDEIIGDMGIHRRSTFTGSTTSPKVKYVMDYIHRLPPISDIRNRSTAIYKEKLIVFSQWTSALNLVQERLLRDNVKFERVDGSMRAKSRQAALERFAEDPEIPVLLLSLMACNTGLNIVSANHVILLDLWWNPTVEEQAINRVHRIGQTRPVTVTRLIMEDTIEERVLLLQDRKLGMYTDIFASEIRDAPKVKKTQKLQTRLDIDFLLA